MTKLGDLPPSWARVEFDEAVTVVSDRGMRIKQKDYLPSGALPVIDQGEGLVGGFTNQKDAEVAGPYPVIVFGDHTRRLKLVSFQFAVGADGVKLFSSAMFWNSAFLFQQLQIIDLENRGYGRHYQYLRKELLALPPLSEQTRIVDKLEELLSDLDAGVAELKAAQKKLAQYRQSLLKAAVEGRLTEAWRAQHGEPEESGAQLLARILRERRAHWEAKQLVKFEAQGKVPPKGWQDKYPEPASAEPVGLPALPAGWVWASLDQLSSSVRNGLSQKPSMDPSGYPILRINAVRAMTVDLNEAKFLSITADEAAGYLLDEGDLLATRYNGSVDLLGVVGVVRGLHRPTVHPDKLIRIKPILSDGLADWIEVCAATSVSRSHVVSRLKTTAGQTGISGDDIKKMPIPLAPKGEKASAIEAIAAAMLEIACQESAVSLSLRQAAAQRKNILQAAFSGQLVPQDPNDEPASVLLERIRAERVARSDTAPKRRRKARALP